MPPEVSLLQSERVYTAGMTRPVRYIPFASGRYEVGVGVRELKDQRFFECDDQLPRYIQAKQAAGAHPTLTCEPPAEHLRVVWAFVANRVNAEYGLNLAGVYHDGAFTEACSRIAEDLVIVSADGERHWMSLMDVRLPSGWDPAQKIGGTLDQVHQPVPGMQSVRRADRELAKMMITRPPMQRFVWGMQYDDHLDHHPARHRRKDFSSDDPHVTVRIERQVIVGFGSVHAALFLIRLHLYPLAELSAEEREALARGIESMSPEARRYKNVPDDPTALLRFIRRR